MITHQILIIPNYSIQLNNSVLNFYHYFTKFKGMMNRYINLCTVPFLFYYIKFILIRLILYFLN
jgi:hypothetical protein